MPLPYDINDKNSILEFADRLSGKSLRDVLPANLTKQIDSQLISAGNKGKFGHKVEKYYFGYEINNDTEPDFPCGLELKVTPLKSLLNGSLSPKERLVCNIINYMEIINERWETSSFLHKNREILMLRYVDPLDSTVSQLDYKFLDVRIHNLITSDDLEQFEEDWNFIVNKIKFGNAHNLSESDTKFLGACTKGADSSSTRRQPYSDEMAMQRAFCFKTQYMKVLLNRSPEIFDLFKTL
ncbi:MAG: hypothetical protein K9J28_07595 [Sulfuritalea sp.]|nr:hypothetical protein [Sulfuritalea sp.]